jgi:hypothetical protein
MELKTDVAIIGGGVGGCAAALAVCRNGKRAVLTEETDWIGGQLTAQAVPPDENRWVETFGGTASYQDYRTRVRDYYRDHYALTDSARAEVRLNPGHGNVSALCHEPRVSLAVLRDLLQPYRSTGQLTVLTDHKVIGAFADGDHVESVTLRDLREGAEVTIHAPYVLDATELGDLLPLTGTEYVTGFESRHDTGELHAPEVARPHDMQAFTYCFALDALEGEDHTIEKPRDYDFWRSYVPEMTPAWTGPLLSWDTTHPVTLEPRTMRFAPNIEQKGEPGHWVFRRIIYRDHFQPGTYRSDICLVNWPQVDYWLGNLCEVSEDETEKHLDAAKQLSLSMIYWMQTEAPRDDGGTGHPELRLRRDIVGTADGLAKYPYIRESRRIKAAFTVLEQHVGKEGRAAGTGNKLDEVRAEVFPDTVGIGHYRIDLHPSSGGYNYLDIDSLPFQIPLGAMIPERVENLLPACKNLGVTHITNGCYRLHPVEWNIGEAAGALASYCLAKNCTPRQVRDTEKQLADFQALLTRQGVRLAWPEDLKIP